MTDIIDFRGAEGVESIPFFPPFLFWLRKVFKSGSLNYIILNRLS